MCLTSASASTIWQTRLNVKLKAVPLNDRALELKPAPDNPRRWNLLCPVTFEATWNGGAGAEDVRIHLHDRQASALEFVHSRVGGGVLSFHTGYLFETEGEQALWACGPANQPKDGLYPLEQLVGASPLTIHWKFTRPNCTVRFDAGEPLGAILPYPKGYAELFVREIDSLSEHQDEMEALGAYKERLQAMIEAPGVQDVLQRLQSGATGADPAHSASIPAATTARTTPHNRSCDSVEGLAHKDGGIYSWYPTNIESDPIISYSKEDLFTFLTMRYGEFLTLELGPGKSKSRLAGIGLNESADPTADIWHDLNDGIPLPDESVEEIYSSQTLEHLRKENQVHIWNEMYRVLKPGGKMEHHVPHYLSPASVGDPTHFTQYSETSFIYYCVDQSGKPFVESFSDYGITARFVLDQQGFETERQGLYVKMHKPAREES